MENDISKDASSTAQQKEVRKLKNISSKALYIPKTNKKSYGVQKQFEQFKNPAIEPFQQSVGMICQKLNGRVVFKGTAILLTTKIVVTCAHCIIDMNQAFSNQMTFKLKYKIIQNTFFYLSNLGIHEESGTKRNIQDSDSFFGIDDILISPRLAFDKNLKSDWAIIKLKICQYNRKTVSIIKKKLTIVYNPIRAKNHSKQPETLIEQNEQLNNIVSVFNVQKGILNGYYIGFYPKIQKDIGDYTPQYAFQRLVLSKNQIFHKIPTVPGTAGGPLIKSLQVGTNQYRLFLVGIHRCLYQYGDTRGGVILDGDFMDKYNQWIKQDIASQISHSFLQVDQFSKEFIKDRTQSFDQNIFEDKSCQKIMGMVKYIIQLFKHYLYFAYNWVQKKYSIPPKRLQQCKRKQIQEHLKSISLLGNNQLQFCFNYLPLKNILELIHQQKDTHSYIFNKFQAFTRNTLDSLTQFLRAINQRVPQTQRNIKDILTSIYRYMQDPINNYKPFYLSLVMKLIKQYPLQYISQLLKDKRIIDQIQYKNYKQQNVVDFFTKNNTLNRISAIACLLRHKYANRVEELNRTIQWNQQKKCQRIIGQYVHNYNEALNLWIQQNCKTNNYYFYLQLKSQHLFSTQQQQQQQKIESMRSKLIILAVFLDYYNGKKQLFSYKMQKMSSSELLNIIIDCISHQIEKKLILQILSIFLLSRQSIQIIKHEFVNQIRKEFVSLCLIYHKQCNIKFNTAIFTGIDPVFKQIYNAQNKEILQDCQEISVKVSTRKSWINKLKVFQKDTKRIIINKKKVCHLKILALDIIITETLKLVQINSKAQLIQTIKVITCQQLQKK